jgi:hypothetical protein
MTTLGSPVAFKVAISLSADIPPFAFTKAAIIFSDDTSFDLQHEAGAEIRDLTPIKMDSSTSNTLAAQSLDLTFQPGQSKVLSGSVELAQPASVQLHKLILTASFGEWPVTLNVPLRGGILSCRWVSLVSIGIL